MSGQPTALFIDACLRQERSRTAIIAQAFCDSFKKSHPKTQLAVRDLTRHPAAGLTPESLALREHLIAEDALDAPEFADAREFAAASAIITAAPFWDLNFPAVLKAYLEQICVAGIAFDYTETGSVGRCKARHWIHITTRGGYATGGFDSMEQGARYLHALTRILGIPAFHCIAAEGLDVEGADVDGILSRTAEQARALAGKL